MLGVIELYASPTADCISHGILECFNRWDINKDKIIAIVSDNGPKITKAVKKNV